MDEEASLLSPSMLARLTRLRLMARRAPVAKNRGRRSTRRIGAGTERIDVRPYAPGDDVRRMAWHAYARLDRPYVWKVADELPARIALVVDTSRSMAYGEPSKLMQATRIAAGLSAIALGGEDRVAGIAVAEQAHRTMRAVTGRAGLQRILHLLDELRADRATDLAAAAAAATAAAGGRALCVVLSDLFDPGGALRGARALRLAGHEVALVEVLHPHEIDPPDLDDSELVDDETGVAVMVPPSGARQAYLDALAAHRAEVDTEALEMGAWVLRATTEEAFEDVVLRAVSLGIVRKGSA